MKQKMDVRQGALARMAPKTLDMLGPLHGYGIARRMEPIGGGSAAVNQAGLCPVPLRLAGGRHRIGYRIGVGPLGKQPPGALLSADACGMQITGSRKTRLGADGGHHRALRSESGGFRMRVPA
jgi:hypothetical protein